MKYFIPLSIFMSLYAGIGYAADWKMHPSFDGEILHLVETPDFTYFTSRVMPINNMFPDRHAVFRYDKTGEEMQSLSTDNMLACNTVSTMAYCAAKGYLAIIYSNFDIDLVYDNGKIVNIPDYRLASVAYPKTVNSISFAPAADRIYLATDFGYVAINDKKHEIAESGIFGTPIASVARIGRRLLLIENDRLLISPLSQHASSLSDFVTVGTFDRPVSLYSLGDDKALMLSYGGSPHSLRVITVSGEDVSVGDPVNNFFYNVEYNRDGVSVSGSSVLYQFKPDASYSSVILPEDDWRSVATSYNMSEIWNGRQRKGIKSSEFKSGNIVTTREYMLPDAPSPFISTDMRQHPEVGLLIQNFGFDYNLQNVLSGPLLLSGYKDGIWENYAPAYTNPALGNVIMRPSGFAIDPDNPDYVYVSSVQNGFARINLKNGEDIIHFSKPSDPSASLPGFVAFVPDQTGANAWSCRFSVPEFDAAGNLWMSYADFDNQAPERLHLLCWEAADRRATVSASDVKLPSFLEVPGIRPTNTDRIFPLSYSTRKNWLLYCNCININRFAIIDTNGTPSDPSDDKVNVINTVYDQDGNVVNVSNVRCLWEDPLTGNVWAGHGGGVFYFNPEDFINGNNRVTRIKVARNDGTNLADYLLNQVAVNKIIPDGSGRKWFATGGAGLVCLSSDNRVIEEELTAEDSGLPDDIVYCIGYIPASNSLMVSTAGGLAEYFLSSSHSPSGKNSVRAYPNPVRPDYVGYVTVDGLPSEAVVKIVDASGNIVRQLHAGSRGEVKWDVSDNQFRRVGSGVYFVLASGGEAGSDFSAVAKILVVN